MELLHKDTMEPAILFFAERLFSSWRMEINYCYRKGVQKCVLCWEVSLSQRVLYQRFHCTPSVLGLSWRLGGGYPASPPLDEPLTCVRVCVCMCVCVCRVWGRLSRPLPSWLISLRHTSLAPTSSLRPHPPLVSLLSTLLFPLLLFLCLVQKIGPGS